MIKYGVGIQGIAWTSFFKSKNNESPNKLAYNNIE